ncbi:MAG TPA: hypothetical protein VJ739_19140, partial [Gemmataceae bacterium]|nr:hypothetical protein [Gemmataceae bacterium]
MARAAELPVPHRPLLGLASEEPPAVVPELIGATLEAVRLLGQRTGEMHRALASRPDDPAFAPEPFSTLYQRSMYQRVRTQARRALDQ